MQRLEVSCAVRHIYTSLGGKGLREEDRLILLKRIPGAKGEEGTGNWWNNAL
jgi:hypothetical protein